MVDDDIALDMLKNIIEDHILIVFLIFKILSKIKIYFLEWFFFFLNSFFGSCIINTFHPMFIETSGNQIL